MYYVNIYVMYIKEKIMASGWLWINIRYAYFFGKPGGSLTENS